jgi:hypothetical protein
VKGFFRRAQAEAGLKEFEAAKATLTEAIKLEPSNRSLRQELEKYDLALLRMFLSPI